MIYWTAAWCGPCKQIGPEVEKLSTDNPTIDIAKIDIDELQSAAQTAQIASVPYVCVNFLSTKLTQLTSTRMAGMGLDLSLSLSRSRARASLALCTSVSHTLSSNTSRARALSLSLFLLPLSLVFLSLFFFPPFRRIFSVSLSAARSRSSTMVTSWGRSPGRTRISCTLSSPRPPRSPKPTSSPRSPLTRPPKPTQRSRSLSRTVGITEPTWTYGLI